MPGGGEYKLRNWDGHYRRYVAAKLHSDDINTRIVGKEVQVKALPCCVSFLRGVTFLPFLVTILIKVLRGQKGE